MSIQNNTLPNNPNIEVIKAKQTGLFTNYIYKAIPLAFDESMSYYETLCGLLNYLKNTILPTLNNNADAVAELQTLYEQLRTYVDNYFTNLDVQEEINNKLDEMVKDGTLTTLIRNYIDPLIDEQNTEISNFKNLINGQIAIINNKVESATSGTPKGVYATVSDLTTADPNHDYIYVVSADGHWYYYNTSTSSWTDGGVYQSTSIANDSIIPSQLENTLKRAIDYIIPTYTIVDNKYRAGSSIYDNNAFAYTNPIELKANHTINAQLKGYGSNITILCIVDSEGNYIRWLQSGETSVTSQINFTTYKDCYVSICYLKEYGIQNLIIYNNLDSNIESINDIDFGTPVLNHYIKSNGEESTYSGGYAMATDYIKITENTKYLIKGIAWETNDNIGTGFYDKNKKFISFIKNTQTENIELISPINAVYMRLTLANNTVNKTRIIIEDTLAQVLNKSYNKENYNKENYNFSIGIADKIICCGDSLTYGLTYTAKNLFYKNYYNYPYFLKRLINNTNVTWKAAGGMTSTSWWNAYSNNLNEENTLFIVWLCTNDHYTDTVNTDCAGNDYTQFADTETGNLGKIIGKILSLTGSKVILVNQFAENDYQETNNKVINDIATKFSVPVIDLTNYDLNNSIYHTAYNNFYNSVHFNNKGHCYVANIINEFINDYNKTNYLEFYKTN